MISERVIRAWYIPAEVLALRRWLVVATVVNIILLTFDYLRGDIQILLFGLFGCGILAVLRNYLPAANNPKKRNISLLLSGTIIAIGIYRLILMPTSLFNFWLCAWMIIPGLIALFWLSNQAVSVWATRELSISAVEYGLSRNFELSLIHI